VEFNWDGTLDDGSKALPGSYRVAAEALVGGQTQAFDVLATAQVNSVSLGGSDDEIMLSLAGIGEVGMSEVKQIK
jgi:flagellar basal-body rod modification protein FlgD